MSTSNMIYKVRSDAKLSQEQFAELFGVSRQAVQKWESGSSLPELDKIIKIAKHFDVSIDSLVLGSNTRITEELKFNKEIKPKYANIHDWESYSSGLSTEYTQSIEEGLDISQYEELFTAVRHLPKGEIKKKLGDILFGIVADAPIAEGYKYIEPSTLEEIRDLREPYSFKKEKISKEKLASKIHGAWMGRTCGCLLGKTVEGIRTNELIPFLKETNNYPMYRYILSTDINEDICNRYKYRFAARCYADTSDGMPADDDMNYVVLAQLAIEKYGRDFTPYDISRLWLSSQGKNSYCTAERVAFCNFIKGFEPPESAIYKNPYREWIGAQIRGDYFGYINPDDPQTAAEMAFRDASISHVKNGIYGEMFIAAMLACAAVTDNIENIIRGGLAEIPHTSRLYESITNIIDGFNNGVDKATAFAKIHEEYDEYTAHGWCHTISNAMIVAASLLYGGGDYGKSICMAVETGFDTDCNGATVGSVLGMRNGIESIGREWTDPIKDKLHTGIFKYDTVKISERVAKTLEHLK